MPTPAELISYYQQALSPISNHAALQSSLAEREAAIRQREAQREQALQDHLSVLNHAANINRAAATAQAQQTRQNEMLREGLRAQGEIARTMIASKADTERAKALAGIQQQGQIAAETRKVAQLGGEAQNLLREQELARGRLDNLRTSLENTLTPPDAALSKMATEAATTAGVTDKAILASIASNPVNLDSIKDRGARDAAKEAYATAVEKYQKLAASTPEARALGRQLQDEGVNYQTLSNQFAQTAGFLTPEMKANVLAQSQQLEPANAFARAPQQAGGIDAILAAVRAGAQQGQPAQPTAVAAAPVANAGGIPLGAIPTTPSPPLAERMATTPFLAPTAQANPFAVPLVQRMENAIGPVGTTLASVGFPPLAVLQGLHDNRDRLTSMLPSWLYQPSPTTSLQGAIPTSAIQDNALANAQQTVDANAAAAALAGTIAAPKTKKKR